MNIQEAFKLMRADRRYVAKRKSWSYCDGSILYGLKIESGENIIRVITDHDDASPTWKKSGGSTRLDADDYAAGDWEVELS